jgi:hypothetical protein
MNSAAPETPEALAFSTAVLSAWRDVRDALTALFTPALIAFLILLALFIVKARVMPTGLVMENLFYEAVKAFLMTPYAIAVHRFIILGEKTTTYRIAPSEPRFRRFFAWSLALSMLANAGAAISLMLPGYTVLNAILESVFGIAAIVVGIRAIVLFPAVAVDAPGANWRQAMADTDGHAWQIFFIIVAVALSLFVVAGLAWVAIRFSILDESVIAPKDPMGRFWTPSLWQMAFWAIVGLFMYTLAVVIASRLYQWIGIRVKERG